MSALETGCLSPDGNGILLRLGVIRLFAQARVAQKIEWTAGLASNKKTDNSYETIGLLLK